MYRDSFLRCLAALARAHNYPLTPEEADAIGKHLIDLDPACIDEACVVLERQAEPHLPFPSVNAIRKAAAQIAVERAEGDGPAPPGRVDSRPVLVGQAPAPRVGGTRR